MIQFLFVLVPPLACCLHNFTVCSSVVNYGFFMSVFLQLKDQKTKHQILHRTASC
jgi:hypothetical protein